MRIIICVVISLLLLPTAFANYHDYSGEDMYVPGYSRPLWQPVPLQQHFSGDHYTVINDYDYAAVMMQSTFEIRAWLGLFAWLTHGLPPEQQLQRKIQLFLTLTRDREYNFVGAQGEGDCHNSAVCQLVQQDPLYRTDKFNCTTWIETLLALLHSQNINDFQQRIVNVEYGGAYFPVVNNQISYFNRNNFMSVDFNPVNQQHGYLQDVTRQGVLNQYAKTQTTVINKQQWFEFMQKPERVAGTVRVVKEASGMPAYQNFMASYPPDLPNLKPQTVSMDYIPKEALIDPTTYVPNVALINALPMPSILEIVRDDQKWLIGGKPISDLIGSGILVSHMGLLYREQFVQGQVIYQKTSCDLQNQQKVCTVTPVTCNKAQCEEVMFAHATDAFPNGYYWYQDQQGYHCSAEKPPAGTSYTTCNRVTSLPLADYLLTKAYGKHIYMDNPSIVGIHLEQVLPT